MPGASRWLSGYRICLRCRRPRDAGSVHDNRSSPEEEMETSISVFSPENPMDRGSSGGILSKGRWADMTGALTATTWCFLSWEPILGKFDDKASSWIIKHLSNQQSFQYNYNSFTIEGCSISGKALRLSYFCKVWSRCVPVQIKVKWTLWSAHTWKTHYNVWRECRVNCVFLEWRSFHLLIFYENNWFRHE